MFGGVLGVTLQASFGETIFGAPFKLIWEMFPPWAAVLLSLLLVGVFAWMLWGFWKFIHAGETVDEPRESDDGYQFHPEDFD